MAYRYGFDLSNYSGVPSLEQLLALKSVGLDWAIIGAQVDIYGNNYTAQQIAQCQLAGIQVLGVYELLYWDAFDVSRFNHAASFNLPVWIDCEFPVRGLSPQDVTGRIAQTVNQLGSLTAGIYTGRWWWPSNTGNTQEFSYLSLWHAEYRNDPFASFVPYGGWSRPVVWQYSSQGMFGVNADLNMWEVTIPSITPPPVPPLPSPTPSPVQSDLTLFAVGLLAVSAYLLATRTTIFKKIVIKQPSAPVTVIKK